MTAEEGFVALADDDRAAGAGADLDHGAALEWAGQADDLAHRVRVDDEVLPPRLRRTHPVTLGELAEEKEVLELEWLECAELVG